MARILFVTGTDTGVGKTVLTALLARELVARGVSVAALKPICSGTREDARALRDALGDALTLDEINPWHFRAPLAPLLAARREGRRVTQAQVVAHTRKFTSRFEVVLVEGAGGLLSPLGEGFDSLSLILALRARPIVVVANRLGAVSQVRLVLAALPATLAKSAPVVLMSPPRADAAIGSNARLLMEFISAHRIHVVPRLSLKDLTGSEPPRAAIRAVLQKLVRR